MPTEYLQTANTKLERIAWRSKKDRCVKFENLMHLYNEESLCTAFHSLDGKKAVGEDGVTKQEYGLDLIEHTNDLLDRMKTMSYRPRPVREVLIPKPGQENKFRPLGISNIEDKIIQKVTKDILEAIHEPVFYECSYGFREGIGPHDAIKDLHQHLFRAHVSRVIDVDLENFFGTLDHSALMKFMAHRIQDTRFLRYARRLMKTGVLKGEELTITEEGIAQGTCCSPILANIYAHYVIDDWFEKVVKKHCEAEVRMFRYCDDIVICCQIEKDALRIKQSLVKRLAKFGLKMNVDKTKIVKFSRSNYRKGIKQGSFDFLGFTFYMGKSLKGRALPKLKTSGKRLRSKLRDIKLWAKSICFKSKVSFVWRIFLSKIRGHIAYYGISFNHKQIYNFMWHARRIMFYWFNRRSQRKSYNWKKFNRFIKHNPMPKKIVIHSLF